MQRVGVTGFAPAVTVGPRNPEAAKYAEMWKRAEYRQVSPGEHWAMTFLAQAKPPRDAEAIDFGCGTGRGGFALALLGGLKTTLVDFVENSLDADVREICEAQPERIKFLRGDLTEPLPISATYGYCCDVMEHIPTEDVDRVLLNVLASAQHVFFAISTVEDQLGVLIGEPLHLTVKPATWWAEKLTTLGAVIHWQEVRETDCAFYCTVWRDAGEVIRSGVVNCDLDVVEAQTAYNIRYGWQQAKPHDRQEREVVLLCGGPSMNDSVDKIRELRAAGAALVTVNGAYQWALDKGLEPSAQIVLDAREFNSRFVDPVTPYTKYLIASQVHPSTFAKLPKSRTLMWHSGISEANEALVRELHGDFFPMYGGSTVVLRAIPLLRMLGYYKLHLFGFDSCVRPDAHHAYAQPENDGEPVVAVNCGGKTYYCAPWMVSQASEFRDIVKFLGDEVSLAVYGDGLIAAIIAAGYDFSQKEQ